MIKLAHNDSRASNKLKALVAANVISVLLLFLDQLCVNIEVSSTFTAAAPILSCNGLPAFGSELCFLDYFGHCGNFIF